MSQPALRHAICTAARWHEFWFSDRQRRVLGARVEAEMANLTCPKCGCPIAVDRGVRLGSVVYCCQPCVDSQPCEFGCSPDRDPAKGAGGVGVIVHAPDFTQRLIQ